MRHSAQAILHSAFCILHSPVALYGLLAAIVIPVSPHFSSPNEFTRWALVAAAVEDHTIEVSRPVRLLGPMFEDLAVVDGRVYSNKAPGAALAAAPGYLAARPFAGPPSRSNLRPVLTMMRWVAATIPLLLLALFFARRDPFAAAVLLFATPLFAYGMLLFSHALVAAALFGAWALLFLECGGHATAFKAAAWPPHSILAGLLIGIAVASEYPTVVVALCFLAALDWRRIVLVVLGGSPFAIGLAVYHKIAFGSVFTTPYAFEKIPQYRSVAGVHVPSLKILGEILFNPAHGLLIFSPILIVCVAALPRAKRALAPRAFWTLVAAAAAVLLIYGGYPNWHGGWTVGPRYVSAALPFLVFPIAFAPPRWWTALLFGASAAAVALPSLTFPFVPLEFPLPWGSLAFPLLRDQLVAPNLFHLIARPLAIAVPFALVLAALLIAVPRRLIVATFAGIAITLAVGFIRTPTPREVVERQYFENVYFERGGPLPPALLRRRDAELPFGPASWPF